MSAENPTDDDLLQLFLTGQQVFGARVAAVTDGQWDGATPCTQWNVADLVDHLVTEHQWAGPLLHGHDLEAAGLIVAGTRELPVDGGVGRNLAESWQEAAAVSADAFSEDGALQRTVSLSSGPRPAGEYIREMIFDLVVHSWDLQRAIGFDDAIPDELVAFGLPMAASFGSEEGSGIFGPAITLPGDAPALDRLVGLTGRDPR